MKAKLWIPVVVLVAGLAFGLGWWYRSQSATADEVAAIEPSPAAAPAYAAPVAAPTRSTPRRTTTVAPSSQPAAPTTSTQAVEVASAAPAEVYAAPHRLTVAEGTKIAFTLNNSLSTKNAREGDPFSGVVSRSVRVGDQVAIPEGSVIRGQVSHVQRAGRVKGRSELGLRFDRLEIPGGETYDLSASLTTLEDEKESVNEEGQVKGEGSKKRDAVTIGAGAGIGAVIGAIAGGGKGAAIGAGGGAAAGTGLVLLTRGKDVELKRGSTVAIQLDRPLTITAQ
ncbi:MAG TPA: hypothetical protein VLB32_07680 [Candidatus Acidoferrales bacterium]|nr:hypothetical protein [Candidatus Acidoferrales bacterium]